MYWYHRGSLSAFAFVRLSPMDGYGAFTMIWNRDRSPLRSTPYHSDGDARTLGPPAPACLLRTASLPMPSRSYAIWTLSPMASATSSQCLRVVVSMRPFSSAYMAAICLAFAYTAA